MTDIGGKSYLITAATKSCPALSWCLVVQNITLTLMLMSLTVKKKQKKQHMIVLKVIIDTTNEFISDY